MSKDTIYTLLCVAVQAVMVGMKLTGSIALSWWWVMSPAIAWVAHAILGTIVYIIITYFTTKD